MHYLRRLLRRLARQQRRSVLHPSDRRLKPSRIAPLEGRRRFLATACASAAAPLTRRLK